MTEIRKLTDAEELANAITHGLGCVIAIVAAALVMTTNEFQNAGAQLGFLCYALSLILVMYFSTASHVVREPQRLTRLRAWDQGAIYLLIAGTYTPGIIAFSSGWYGRGILIFVWSVAAFGLYSKVIAEHRVYAVTTITYLLLGWVPALMLFPVVPRDYFWWLLAGGIAYSAGVVFLVNDHRVRYFHAGWHLWVMFAAGIHFYAICSMAI